MQELEKILEEIKDELKDIYLDIANNYNISDLQYDGDKVACVASKFRCDAVRRIEKIILKHMNDDWVSVEERLPENAKRKGALCPRYQLMTRYGVTDGWYNPDLESWYILIWFMTERYLESEIDFERGTWPKIVRCENKVNDRHNIVMAWRPLPEPYKPERRDTVERESDNL